MRITLLSVTIITPESVIPETFPPLPLKKPSITVMIISFFLIRDSSTGSILFLPGTKFHLLILFNLVSTQSFII